VHPVKLAAAQGKMEDSKASVGAAKPIGGIGEELRSAVEMRRAAQDPQGIVRQQDIDSDASVQIGSQTTPASGAPQSPLTVSAPSPDQQRSSLAVLLFLSHLIFRFYPSFSAIFAP
jgi:hypothetical protein